MKEIGDEGFKAVVEKNDFTLSREIDAAEWGMIKDAPDLLREGSIAWQLVKAVTGDETDELKSLGRIAKTG